MGFTQKISPNPKVWCRPGWCLAFLKDAFGLRAVYPTAISAWEASSTKHRDWDFPDDVWIPVWFSMVTEPAGHVALRAPDGSVYSTSDYTNVAKHHPSMTHLLEYYAYYNMPLVYLGWTEDVEGQIVITSTEEEEEVTQDQINEIVHRTNTFTQKLVNERVNDLTADFTAKISVLGQNLGIDEKKLAEALLEAGKITIESK